MKKFLIIAISLIMGFAAAFAETETVKDRSGKQVGTVNWSYSIQTHETREGSFTTITATNNSKEYVTISFKTDAGGYESLDIQPYETKEVIIGTEKAATKAYCMSISSR